VNLAGYRKFIAALFVLVSATGMVIFKVISQETYADVVKWVTGLYLASNVAAKGADTLTVTRKEEKPAA
jgi:hypothetical protein